jgi:pyridoxamine 5'-phosphate oxidase like protein
VWDGHELHARPMGANVRREDDAIYFLTDARHHKDQDSARYPKVCLAFADTSGQKYVSLAAVADGVHPGGVRQAGMIAEHRTNAVEQEPAADHPRLPSMRPCRETIRPIQRPGDVCGGYPACD